MKLMFDMMERPNVFPLLGNHEMDFWDSIKTVPLDASIDNFMNYLGVKGLISLSLMISNGGRVTLEQYFALTKEDRALFLDFLRDFMLFYELTVGGREFVLTHSGLMHFKKEKDIAAYEPEDYLCDRPGYGKRFYSDKTIVFGHSPTFIYPQNPQPGRILKTKTYIHIDCGCVYKDSGGRLGCLRLDDMREFYAE